MTYLAKETKKQEQSIEIISKIMYTRDGKYLLHFIEESEVYKSGT